MSEPEAVYVSRKPCGCIGITVGEREPRTPTLVMTALRNGEIVDRMPAEAARALAPLCQAHTPPARQESLL